MEYNRMEMYINRTISWKVLSASRLNRREQAGSGDFPPSYLRCGRRSMAFRSFAVVLKKCRKRTKGRGLGAHTELSSV